MGVSKDGGHSRHEAAPTTTGSHRPGRGLFEVGRETKLGEHRQMSTDKCADVVWTGCRPLTEPRAPRVLPSRDYSSAGLT
jgi:hypothetical protein